MPQADESNRERLIVGLGNPGERYRHTRHNLGFRVIFELADRWQVNLERLECNALIAVSPRAVLAAPQTYMNRSGFAVRCLRERRALRARDIMVVYDDVHLTLGRLRLRPAGGPGGHRGMESIVQNLRTETIPRLRLGIGAVDEPAAREDLVEFVLSPFEEEEQQTVAELIGRAADACDGWLEEGLEATMSRFNC